MGGSCYVTATEKDQVTISSFLKQGHADDDEEENEEEEEKCLQQEYVRCVYIARR